MDERTTELLSQILATQKEQTESGDQDERFQKYLGRAIRVSNFGMMFGSLLCGIAFAMPMRPGYREVDPLGIVLAMIGALLFVLSATVISGSLVLRAAANVGYRPWQFSLKWLLVVTTALAVLLGLSVYLARVT